MNKPLPEVSCPKCHLLQPFRGQQNCLHCSSPLSQEDLISVGELRRMFHAPISSAVVEKESRQKIP